MNSYFYYVLIFFIVKAHSIIPLSIHISEERCDIPIYTYQCDDCGFRFTKRRTARKSKDPLRCDLCNANVYLAVPETMNSQMKVSGDGSINPQNTGVSSYDANVDRVIGDHAETSWKSIDNRLSHKRKILNNHQGITGFDLSRQKDGDYRIMSAQERKASETARNLHNRAMSLFQKRDERDKKGKK